MWIALWMAAAWATPTTVEVSAFVIDKEVRLSAPPMQVWEALTGDISPWWDHTFSASPHALFIEPKPGGGFFEYFDEHGHGVRHAVVTWADPGKKLTLVGPLGLEGYAFDMTHALTLTADGDQTVLHARISGFGEVQEGWPEAVDGVWTHFLEERLVPFVAGELDDQTEGR